MSKSVFILSLWDFDRNRAVQLHSISLSMEGINSSSGQLSIYDSCGQCSESLSFEIDSSTDICFLLDYNECFFWIGADWITDDLPHYI
jgi:hypothetical protein